MRIPFLNKTKKNTKRQERLGRKRKEHVTLPINIPQNIVDWFIAYREWRKDQDAYAKGHKDKMLKELDVVCRKWHLWNGWESCAGSYWIYLTNGLVVYTHINEDKPLVIHTCVLGKQFETWEDQPTEASYGDKDYVYHWDNYEPLTIE